MSTQRNEAAQTATRYANDSGVFRGVEVPKPGEILSMIAHDMRGPLSAIVGATELLAEPSEHPLNLAQLHLLEITRRSVDRLRSLAEDLGELGAAGSGTLELDRSRHDLSSLLHMAVEETCLSPYAAGKRVIIDARERAEALVDGPRLGRALMNAVAHVVESARSAVRVSLDVADHELVIAIEGDRGTEDGTGDGVAARGGAGRASEPRLGIGFAIVVEIVHAHGGTWSRAGDRITLRLPRGAQTLRRSETP